MLRIAVLAAVLLSAATAWADKPPIGPVKPPADPTENPAAVAQVRALLAAGKKHGAKIRLAPKMPALPAVVKLANGEAGLMRDGPGLGPLKILQIVDGSNAIVRQYGWGDKRVFWLSGFLVDGLSDGDLISGVLAVVEVAGTKRYQTANGGSLTVPLVEPFPWDVTAKLPKR